MYRIIGSKCCGKTSQLILLAKETGAAIACSNPMAMEVKAHAYGIVGVNFISYDDALHYQGDLMIDELELFINYAMYGKLVGYTLSEED